MRTINIFISLTLGVVAWRMACMLDPTTNKYRLAAHAGLGAGVAATGIYLSGK